MKIYIEGILLINFFFDFILLLGTSYISKKEKNTKRLLLGALFGSLSILLLFMSLTTYSLFLLKLIISIIIILVSFGRKSFFKTYMYFYILSIFLGGFMYFLNMTFSLKNEGLVFFYNGLSINLIVIVIISPVIIFLYVRSYLINKRIYSNYYNIVIYINNNKYNLRAYLDTGNNLYDPYKKRPVILINTGIIDIDNYKYILVPYQTIDSRGLIKCIKPDKVLINKKEFTCLVGEVKKQIRFKDIDCILPNILKEELV